ncbi:hypothetical protein LRY65_04885 [Candidatus Woesebacteria bacterium]|nr:hypothetical protein [Candidatus Woesebacteria bacterium]MCD8506875.1 hypothetical protein [Candidatus Woesebacteria bacterium]MCD8527506.1 hypothetical protein [Candidatus Woesebacteria bacterium]MCD8546246.1 hypothetical protein [Candidatus Woesebacteria bacterium]
MTQRAETKGVVLYSFGDLDAEQVVNGNFVRATLLSGLEVVFQEAFEDNGTYHIVKDRSQQNLYALPELVSKEQLVAQTELVVAMRSIQAIVEATDGASQPGNIFSGTILRFLGINEYGAAQFQGEGRYDIRSQRVEQLTPEIQKSLRAQHYRVKPALLGGLSAKRQLR